jgi:hypothetical protein
MYYIQYHPGTIATIITHPTEYGSPHANELSQAVNSFNQPIITVDFKHRTQGQLRQQLDRFEKHFTKFKLTNSDHENLTRVKTRAARSLAANIK